MSNVLVQPFKKGDIVYRFTNHEFNPEQTEDTRLTVESCRWDGVEWVLKFYDDSFADYDADCFALVPSDYDKVAAEIFGSPPTDEVPVKPTQHVYAVLDEMKGQYIGFYAFYHSAVKAIGEQLTNATQDDRPIIKVAFEIERIEVQQ